MRLKGWLRRHYAEMQIACSIGVSTLVGLYVKEWTELFGKSGHGSFATGFGQIGAAHLVAVGAVLLLLCQMYMATLPIRGIREVRRAVVQQTLEAACKSLVRPRIKLHIRAIVTLAQFGKRTRKTTYSYGVRPDPERTAVFPIDFGVTGEAFLRRAAMARELPPDHLAGYPDNVRPLILPGLKCVLAVPIFNPDDPEGPLLGVLAFDSTETIATMRFDDRESLDIAQAWADVIAILIAA